MSDIKTVGVAGTGMMSSGIAEVAAMAGFEVLVRGRTQSAADAALGRMAKSLDFQVYKGKLSTEDSTAAFARVTATTELEHFDRCHIVVESVVEDLEVKKQLFAELDRICGDDTILATNTSTLSVNDIGLGNSRPERILGLHFFNPAPRMPVVELVHTSTTAEETIDAVRQFATDCGKEAVTVKDNAGFIVNALLFPYLNGAVQMLDSEIASREDIDAAMKGGCGFPMGPLQVLDLVGLDVSLSILEALYEERHDPCTAPAPLLRRMVTAEQLGRKTGQGFYTYPAAS